MTLLRIVQAAREAGNPALLADAMPYAKWLGLAPENGTGELLTRLRFDKKNIGNPHLPAIHGGVIGATLETAAIFHMLWIGEALAVPKIVTITVDYLRSAYPIDLLAKATLTKQGRRIANVAVEAWQDDRSKPIASARMHFLLPTPTSTTVKDKTP